MATGMWQRLVRRWWVAVLLLILVTVGALAWNASPASPHTYTATRTLVITVLSGDGDSAYGASVAQASEATLARKLAAPSLLSSPAYTAAVIGQLAGTSPSRTPGEQPTAAMVAHAVSASNNAGEVILSVSWDSAAGAAELADAAVQTLATAGAPSALPDDSSIATAVEGLGDPARLDTGAEVARLTDILVRGGLAALAVLIVAGALTAAQTSGWRGAGSAGHEPEGSTQSSVG